MLRRPAGQNFDGAAAMHTHMTNSRLTDPEVLESRFPVVLEDFHIRRGSGGKGRWRAGDGTLRRIRFLKHMHVAILSGHRAVPNPGAMGGEPGELAATRSAATTAGSRFCRAARRRRSRPGRRSRSSRRPGEVGEKRDNYLPRGDSQALHVMVTRAGLSIIVTPANAGGPDCRRHDGRTVASFARATLHGRFAR